MNKSNIIGKSYLFESEHFIIIGIKEYNPANQDI